MKHQNFYKELRRLINPAIDEQGRKWLNLGIQEQELVGRLKDQAERYKSLPTLTQVMNEELKRILPAYRESLKTTQDRSIYKDILRFIPNQEKNEESLVLNNLKAYIIKHEIEKEYVEIREFRKRCLSIEEDQGVSKETIVQTYPQIHLIQFVKHLHNDVFFYSSSYRYFESFTRLFLTVVGDEEITHGRGLCRKLRPADLEKLIQLLIYSNRRLTVEQRRSLGLDEVNKLLIHDLKTSNLKVSNRELFTLLQLSLTAVGTSSQASMSSQASTSDQTDTGDHADASAMISQLYGNFKASSAFEKDAEFFTNFLTYAVQNDTTPRDTTLVNRIVSDLIDAAVVPDRALLVTLFRASLLLDSLPMTELVALYLLDRFVLDMRTLSILASGYRSSPDHIATPIMSAVLELCSKIGQENVVPKNFSDSFQMKILDHLMEKRPGPAHPTGLLFHEG